MTASPNEIAGFKGEYAWLSNFYPCYIPYRGFLYPSAEHAYQSAKSEDMIYKIRVRNCQSAALAKKEGKSAVLRLNWLEIRDTVMENVQRLKYDIPELRRLLIATGDKILVEENWWNDTYWGRCRGKGQNKLGKIIMRERDEALP